MKIISTTAPVLVTGASGYIASWIIKQLLEQGYKVHGTVRSLKKSDKITHLLDLANQYPGKLELFEADLLVKGSFKEAMKGCEVVMHTASPFQLRVKDAHKELIVPALEGTKNVFQTIQETETVKRVVLTSSVVAIYGDAIDVQKTENNIFTEKHWNTSSSAAHQPYPYSKTVAEKAAWELTNKQSRWDLVTIHPGFVLGPALSLRSDSTSMDFIISCLNGKYKSGMPNLYSAYVDVRDVAAMHLKAAFTPEANGRYIAVGHQGTMLEIADVLKAKYGKTYPLPKGGLPKWLLFLVGPGFGLTWKFIRNNVNIPFQLDNSRSVKEMGINYRPFEETVLEQAEFIIQHDLYK